MAISVDEFKEAAWKANWDTVKKFVEAGGDVNAIASNGVNALVAFDIKMLDYLHEHGADPSITWADGSSPIGFHAWELNAEGVRWFIEKKVDPNVIHLKTKESCLHNLTAKPKNIDKRFEIIKYLLSKRADPNARAAEGVETGSFMRDVQVVGETPLHRAAAYQSKATIELLLEKGADKTLRDGRGESALSWASRHWRKRDILKLLS